MLSTQKDGNIHQGRTELIVIGIRVLGRQGFFKSICKQVIATPHFLLAQAMGEMARQLRNDLNNTNYVAAVDWPVRGFGRCIS